MPSLDYPSTRSRVALTRPDLSRVLDSSSRLVYKVAHDVIGRLDLHVDAMPEHRVDVPVPGGVNTGFLDKRP